MRSALPILLAALTGCTIYAPLQPPAPDIYRKGQLELAGGARLSMHVEGSATYSPLNHLLVRVAGGGTPLPPDGAGVQFAAAHGEGSLGTYWPLGQNWLAGGFGGLGAGRSRLRYLHSIDEEDYRARFLRPFGEVYLHRYLSPYLSLGATYRLNQVRYSSFTNAGLPTSVRNVVRSEPQLFLRVGDKRGTETRAVRVQLCVGMSVAHGPRQRWMDGVVADPPLFQAKRSTLYTTASIIFCPPLLRRPKSGAQ